MRKVLLIAFLMFLITAVKAQQSAVLSQAAFNAIVINPAVAGSSEDIPLHFQFRRQWSGIDQAPVTQLVSTHSRLGDQIGIGGYVYNDVAGPTRNTGIDIGLSYRTKLNEGLNLSFGLAGQLFQFSVDNSQLTTDQPGDLTIESLGGSRLTPDMSAGLMIGNENWNVGISGLNLFNSQQNMFDPSMPIINAMERTFYLHARYRAGDKKKTSFEPYLVSRAIQQGIFQFDLGLRAFFRDKFFIGAGYRYESAAIALAGARFGQFEFSYAYDMGLDELREYHSGSHELLIGYRFIRKERNTSSGRTPWMKRNRIYTPTDNN